jgi:SAM-dependent methyltransferase
MELTATEASELLRAATPLTEEASSAAKMVLETLQRGASRYVRAESLPMPACKWTSSTFQSREPWEIFSNLRIPEQELNTPGLKIADIGAGAQILAKEGDRLQWASEIHSVEPRLGITQEFENRTAMYPRDISSMYSVHRLAVGAMSDALPYPTGYFDRIYANFSVPYYQDSPTEIRGSMQEMLRVLKPEGIGRIFPVTRRHEGVVRSIMQASGRPFELTYVNTVVGGRYAPEQGFRLTTLPIGS